MPTPEPSLLLEPVQRLLTHLSDPAAPRRLIALAGLPGSGKSTVAQRWVNRVNEAHSAARSAKAGGSGIEANSERAERAEKRGNSAAGAAQTDVPAMVTLSMDGFHLTKAELARFADPAEAFERRGAPWTFDAAAFGERLQALRVTGENSENR